jgi:hypothetical protein
MRTMSQKELAVVQHKTTHAHTQTKDELGGKKHTDMIRGRYKLSSGVLAALNRLKK